jgi:uncharacterized membrane protein YfbV (UPF0208 family)
VFVLLAPLDMKELHVKHVVLAIMYLIIVHLLVLLALQRSLTVQLALIVLIALVAMQLAMKYLYVLALKVIMNLTLILIPAHSAKALFLIVTPALPVVYVIIVK